MFATGIIYIYIHILTSRASIHPPLSELYKDQGEVAYAINKQYASILMNCDNHGWRIYLPTGEVRLYDGVIDIGRNYTESTDGFALQGNGWYCDSLIDKASTYELITS